MEKPVKQKHLVDQLKMLIGKSKMIMVDELLDEFGRIRGVGGVVIELFGVCS